MAKAQNPIPPGYHTVTPHLVIKGCAQAIEFYKRAFGAEETMRMPAPDGRVVHAEVRVGDSIVMMSDEMPEMGTDSRAPVTLGGNTGGLMLYVPDVDALFARAVAAGAKVTMPVTDMFWGDRYGRVQDPYGHSWAMATHVEDLTQAEIAERSKAHAAGSPS